MFRDQKPPQRVTSGAPLAVQARPRPFGLDHGAQLSPSTQGFFSKRFDHDFARVRIHADTAAAASAESLAADAYTYGDHVVFNRGRYQPDSSAGRELLAHELAHVIQQEGARPDGAPQVSQPGDPAERSADHAAACALGHRFERIPILAPDPGRPASIARKTKGEVAVDKAHADWLDPDADVKAHLDVVKVALKEIGNGNSVEYNRKAGRTKISLALTTLGKAADYEAAESEWDWLVDNARAMKADYKTKQAAFFGRFKTPLATMSAQHPASEVKYWLKNTAPQIVDEVIAVSDADLPADQLWTYASREGLVDYVRDEIGLAKTADPTIAQLKTVSTTQDISGFDYLGTDDYWDDLSARNRPMSRFLPASYDQKKVTAHVPATNELGRTVVSTVFPNLKMGLQALSATMKRRRAIFLDDVKTYGYAKPTTDELVYWTYVYYNAGEFNGQLKKYKGNRVLSDWITKKEYLNSIKVVDSYRMIHAMKIF